MMDIVYLVLGNIIAVTLVQAVMKGGESVFLYLIIAAGDVAYVYNKFRGRK